MKAKKYYESNSVKVYASEGRKDFCLTFNNEAQMRRLGECLVDLARTGGNGVCIGPNEDDNNTQLEKDEREWHKYQQYTVEGYNLLPETFSMDDIIRCFRTRTKNTALSRAKRMVDDRLAERIARGVYKKIPVTERFKPLQLLYVHEAVPEVIFVSDVRDKFICYHLSVILDDIKDVAIYCENEMMRSIYAPNIRMAKPEEIVRFVDSVNKRYEKALKPLGYTFCYKNGKLTKEKL